MQKMHIPTVSKIETVQYVQILHKVSPTCKDYLQVQYEDQFPDVGKMIILAKGKAKQVEV